MEKELLQKVDAFIEANKQAILDDIAALVAVDSVQSAPAPDAPFGEGAKRALEVTLEIAERMGLTTRNCENYIGYAELPGADPEKYLATICHVDVVPVGNGWDADPFTMRIRDNWLLGRGVADDKGPMVITLYTLKCLKELGVSLRYPIRALAGTNEETGMLDVDYYLENYPAPVFAFSPDAAFPVCNGEKGLFGANIVSPVFENGAIVDFAGGVANNAIPDRAYAVVKADINAMTAGEGVSLSAEGEGLVRVSAVGKAGHAASPAGTINAISRVVDCLVENNVCTAPETAYLKALQKLHSSTAGEGVGIACEDGPFGPLTIIGGRIYMEDGKLVQTCDSRYPTTTTGEAMVKAMREAIGDAAEVVLGHAHEPFYIEADSPAIRACIDTFNEVTGNNAEPFTMGGGTYARHFPAAVSFGPEYDAPIPEFGGGAHAANEAAPFDILLQALKIYVVTMLRLEAIEF